MPPPPRLCLCLHPRVLIWLWWRLTMMRVAVAHNAISMAHRCNARVSATEVRGVSAGCGRGVWARGVGAVVWRRGWEEMGRGLSAKRCRRKREV